MKTEPAESPGKGRPTIYSQELAEAICLRLSGGESLRAICRDADMPADSTVRLWAMDPDHDFSARYTRAREVQAHTLADEILEISDTPQLGVKTKVGDDGKVETTEGDMIEHRRLRVDSRKWYLSKVLPKVYGDKVAVGGADDLPPVAVQLAPLESARRIAFALQLGLKAAQQKAAA